VITGASGTVSPTGRPVDRLRRLHTADRLRRSGQGSRHHLKMRLRTPTATNRPEQAPIRLPDAAQRTAVGCLLDRLSVPHLCRDRAGVRRHLSGLLPEQPQRHCRCAGHIRPGGGNGCSALAGLILADERAFLARDAASDFLIALIALGSIAFRRPLVGIVLREFAPQT
jgi:hypothetical protein